MVVEAISLRTAVNALLSEGCVSRSGRYHFFLVEDLGLLGCDTVSLGEWFQTFQRFAFPSSSVVKQSEHSFCTPQLLEMKALKSFTTSGTTCLVRQHYMPENRNPQQRHFEIPVIVFR
jgi:hypothetical protein